MGKFFIFGGYSAFRLTEFAYISDLVDNAIKYASPNMGGLQLRALVAAGEGSTGRTAEFGGMYTAGPFDAALTYREAKGINGKTDKLTTGGLSYALGDVRLHGGYSKASPKAAGLPDATSYDVGVVYTAMPALILTLDYVARDQKGTSNDSNFLRFGTDYFLSKRTSVIFNVMKLENKGTASQRFYGNGTAGKGQNIIALGLRNTF